MTTDMTVAKTILEQLGGNKFLAMTGAKNLLGDANSLTFRIPMRTLDGSNTVKITLTAMDDYTLEFLSVRAGKVKPKTFREGVYNENLQEVFTRVTGLHTSLGEYGAMKMTRKNWRSICNKAYTLTMDGQRIEAVKLLRNSTGCGLKEALDATKQFKPMAW